MTTIGKLFFGTIALLFVAGSIYYFGYRDEYITPVAQQEMFTIPEEKTTTSPSTRTTADKCTFAGGTWSEEYKECVEIGSDICTEMDGTFNECASPCRHNPEAEVCITMCVQVCTF